MSHTVLVCDDAIFMRTMISDILTQAGFEVVGEAESGEEAVELADSLSPGLVLMDINLPGMSGIEATRRVTAEPPGTFVLLVSTYEVDDLPAGAATSGALAYVHKEHLDVDLVEDLWRERALAMWRTA